MRWGELETTCLVLKEDYKRKKDRKGYEDFRELSVASWNLNIIVFGALPMRIGALCFRKNQSEQLSAGPYMKR